jgi:hypothetical protein
VATENLERDRDPRARLDEAASGVTYLYEAGRGDTGDKIGPLAPERHC